MEYKTPIIDFIPEFVREYQEIQQITSTEQAEFDIAWKEAEKSWLNNFVVSANENGIKRWERVVGIIPSGDADLDERKFAVLIKTNEQLPYTYRALAGMLERICGANGYTINLQPSIFSIDVKVGLAKKNNFSVVKELLEKIIPVNLNLSVDLIYNQHKNIQSKTHAQLTAYTHNRIRNEVI